MEKKITHEKVYRTELQNGKAISESKYLHSEQKYNNNGDIILSATYEENETLIEKNIIHFNEEGQKISSEYYIEEDSVSEKTKSEYNDKKELIKENIIFADSSETETSFEYKDGHIIAMISFDPEEDEVIESTRREINDAGKILKEEKFEYGELVSSQENKYDKEGHLLLRKTFDPESGGIIEEKYSVQNNKIHSWTKTFPNGQIEEFNNTFNEKGEIQKIEYKGLKYTSQTELEYDDKANIISEKESLENGTVLVHVQRKFEENLLLQNKTFVNRMGQAPDLEYLMEYVYE